MVERPLARASLTIRFVAAMIRAPGGPSALCGDTVFTQRSASAAWADAGRSQMSSKNNVPSAAL